jgi:hypothetical protein
MLVALCDWVVDPGVMLSEEQAAELRAVLTSREVPAVVATRARIVLWMGEGRRRKDVAELAGVSLPTVDRWVARYATDGLAGSRMVRMPRRVSRCRVGSGVGFWR